MAFVRSILENQLGWQKAYECALWAFGNDFEEMKENDLRDRWNKIHSDLLFLKESGEIKTDMVKILDFWKQQDENRI